MNLDLEGRADHPEILRELKQSLFFAEHTPPVSDERMAQASRQVRRRRLSRRFNWPCPLLWAAGSPP